MLKSMEPARIKRCPTLQLNQTEELMGKLIRSGSIGELSDWWDNVLKEGNVSVESVLSEELLKLRLEGLFRNILLEGEGPQGGNEL